MTKMMWSSVTSLGATLLLCTGCPAPPMDAGPPPAPGIAVQTETATDSSNELPAPVLPDPRPDLPRVTDGDVSAPATAADATSPSANQFAGGTERKVYSVQVFAATSRENAEAVAQRARGVTPSEVEVVAEADGIFRVYAGVSSTRGPTDQLRDELRGNGFGDSWTRQRSVRVAVVSPTSTQPNGAYSVQVFASENEEAARQMMREVSAHTAMSVEAVQIGNLWKVLVGRSDDRSTADLERDRLRGAGYTDAWTLRR
jgi:hypothetical protein